MSLLSDCLDKHLKELQAPAPKPKAPVVQVAPYSRTTGPDVVKAVSLYFQEGSSDKVYHIQIVIHMYKFLVNFQYGRRDGTMTEGTKTSYPVIHSEAVKIYQKLLNEKTAKGYKVL